MSEIAVSEFLSDGVVALRPIEREDLPLLARWRNNPRIRTVTREFRPLNMENQEVWFNAISATDTKNFMFAVATQSPGGPVGVVGLCHWSPRDRTAEVSFYFGEEQAEGKGHAKRALVLLHEWGWRELGLDRIWAEAYDDNDRSQFLRKHLGYKEEGRLREHVWRGGKRVDSIMLGVLRSEWKHADS